MTHINCSVNDYGIIELAKTNHLIHIDVHHDLLAKVLRSILWCMMVITNIIENHIFLSWICSYWGLNCKVGSIVIQLLQVKNWAIEKLNELPNIRQTQLRHKKSQIQDVDLITTAFPILYFFSFLKSFSIMVMFLLDFYYAKLNHSLNLLW